MHPKSVQTEFGWAADDQTNASKTDRPPAATVGVCRVSARSIKTLEDRIDARINFGVEIEATFHELSDDELDDDLSGALEALTTEAAGGF